MLTLSPGAHRALSDQGRDRFAQELARHAEGYAPGLSRVVGRAGMLRVAASWIDRAGAHGFTMRGPTRLFAELALTFGSAFDHDPQLPWARQILGDRDLDEMQRARSLFTAAHEFLDETAGPDDVHSFAALRDLRRMTAMPDGDESRSLEARIVDVLGKGHPAKARCVGEAAMRRLVAGARQTCARHGLTGDPPVLLLTGMMFGFGHGVAEDPLYPWVGRTLKRVPTTAEDGRVDHLARKVMIYVEAMLARGSHEPQEMVAARMATDLAD